MDITNRLRRNRKNPIIREMVAETRLHKDMLVYPVFAMPGKSLIKEISSMPGIFNYSVDELIKHTEKSLKLGVNKLLIFGVGEEKSENAISSHQQNSIVSIAISELKKEFKDDIFLISDVCLCAYTTHGHCGVLENGYVKNDESVDILMVKPALAYLDVIKQLKLNTNLPIACYNVSGEYSMVKAASLKGWVDEGKIVRENLTAFARAGASIIITYHALDALENNWL